LSVLLAPALAQAQDDMSSGGLAPPPAIEGAEPYDASATERELDQADRKDAGRGLEFLWVNAEVGVQHLGLQTFKANDLVDAEIVSTTQTGPLFGAGLGVRLIFITLGGRFRLGSFEEWQVWTLDAEVGVRIPLGALEPYFVLAGGYASLGSFDGANVAGADDDVAIRGFNLRGGVGLDYYIGNTFSIGGNVSGDFMFLSRTGLDFDDVEGEPNGEEQATRQQIYAQDGSGIGGGVTVTLVAGLHF
jgi:hypothetical protein